MQARWIKRKIGWRGLWKAKAYGVVVVQVRHCLSPSSRRLSLPFTAVLLQGNSHKLRDSYTYTLKRLLELPVELTTAETVCWQPVHMD